MIYLKTEVDGKVREIEIYGTEIFTTCFKCSKEFQVDEDLQREILKDEGSFSGVSLSCGCNTEKPNLIRIK